MEFNQDHSPLYTVAEIELQYIPQVPPSERPVVNNSKEAYELFRSTWDMGKIQLQEQFKIMLLNVKNRVLGICTCATGTSTSTIVDVRLVFACALKGNATKVILCHNHPSASLYPSESDRILTARFKSIGRLLEIIIADHQLISNKCFFSFADEGLL